MDRKPRRRRTDSRSQLTWVPTSFHFDKSIAVDANDVDPFNDTDTTPQELLAAIAANKRKDDGGGEPI
jgi:hypothetical protein